MSTSYLPNLLLLLAPQATNALLQTASSFNKTENPMPELLFFTSQTSRLQALAIVLVHLQFGSRAWHFQFSSVGIRCISFFKNFFDQQLGSGEHPIFISVLAGWLSNPNPKEQSRVHTTACLAQFCSQHYSSRWLVHLLVPHSSVGYRGRRNWVHLCWGFRPIKVSLL